MSEDELTVDIENPWGLYRMKCLGCGCPMLQVELIDDVESGRVALMDSYCTVCSTGVRPSPKREIVA